MKKMIKMSLIASVAIAGLTTTASATAMEDSIKNTDLSGYIRYRYTNGEAKTENNQYKLVAVTKSKVNDMVTAKIKVSGEAGTTNVSGDVDPGVTGANVYGVREANFIFNVSGNTIIAGKQALVTPFADPSQQQGSGLVGLFPVGPVTLAAGWYTNTDAEAGAGSLGLAADTDLDGANIGAIAAIGAAGPVNYAVWYAKVSEGNTGEGVANVSAKAININVSGKFGPVSVELNHASIDYSGTLTAAQELKDEQTQTRVVVGANAGPVALTLGYVKTGDEGGNATLGDSDASSNFSLEEISADATTDASIWYLGAKAPVGPVTVGLEHLRTADYNGGNTDEAASETKLSVAYAMSKNFEISAFATDGKMENAGAADTDLDMTRVQMIYTF